MCLATPAAAASSSHCLADAGEPDFAAGLLTAVTTNKAGASNENLSITCSRWPGRGGDRGGGWRIRLPHFSDSTAAPATRCSVIRLRGVPVLNTVAGVNPAGAPWGITSLDATIRNNGDIRAVGEGVLLWGADGLGSRAGPRQLILSLFCRNAPVRACHCTAR